MYKRRDNIKMSGMRRDKQKSFETKRLI